MVRPKLVRLEVGVGSAGACSSSDVPSTIALWPELTSTSASAECNKSVTIGRSVSNDVRLNPKHFPGLVSRRHAEFRVSRKNRTQGGGEEEEEEAFEVEIIDLGGLNGTYVDGIRLDKGVAKKLKEEQTVSFGAASINNQQNELVYRFIHEEEVKEKKKPENENVGGKRSCIDLTADQDETEKADQAASAAKKSKLGPASDEGWMDTIESHFECVICKDFLVKTTAIVPCGHIACRDCLKQWLKRDRSCPVCRAAVKESKLCPLIFVDSFLERIKTFFDDAERSMFDERLKDAEAQGKDKTKKKTTAQENNRPTVSSYIQDLTSPAVFMLGDNASRERQEEQDDRRYGNVVINNPNFVLIPQWNRRRNR